MIMLAKKQSLMSSLERLHPLVSLSMHTAKATEQLSLDNASLTFS